MEEQNLQLEQAKLLEQKRSQVNQLIQKSHDLIVKADKNYDQFYYKDAHSVYIESIDGFMQLLKMTTNDANF